MDLCGCFGGSSHQRRGRGSFNSDDDWGGKDKKKKADRVAPVHKKQQALTVDSLRQHKKDQLKKDPSKAAVDDLHTVAKMSIVNLKTTLEIVAPVFPEDFKNFIRCQNKARKKLGCSKRPPSESAKHAFRDLISERNQSAKTALRSLQSVQAKMQNDTSMGQKAATSMKKLADFINEGFKISTKSGVEANRLKFYPLVVIKDKDSDNSPEECFDGFTSVQTAITVFEGLNKKQWLDAGSDDLYKLFSELYFIILERFPNGAAVSKMVSSAVNALKTLDSSERDWGRGALQKASSEQKSSLKEAMHKFYSAKVERDIAKIRAKGDDSKVKKASDWMEKCAVGLYNEQKSFFFTEAKKWIIVKNSLPELFHDLQPPFVGAADLLLTSTDVTEEYRTVISLFTDRTLQEYDNLEYIQPDLIHCTYERKETILKRFNLTRRQDIKALFKGLVMQKKLQSFVVEQASAVFVDNSDAYLHLPRGESNFEITMKNEKFNTAATTVILFIRQMVRAIHEIHSAGVIHGDIQPSSWFVTESGLAKVHAFATARLATQTQGVRESVYTAGYSPFVPPEVHSSGKDSTSRTEAGDIYNLGQCVKEVASACKAALEKAGMLDAVKELISQMTAESATKRPTSQRVFAKTDDLFGMLKNQIGSVKKQRQDILDAESSMKKAKGDLEHAAQLAEDDLARVANVAQDVKKKEQALFTKHKRLQEDARALMSRQYSDDSLKPPHYWFGKSLDQMVNIYPIDKNGSLFQVFRHLIVTDDPKSLNKGRDVVERGDYTFLDLVGVWRIENSLLWQNYATERRSIRKILGERNVKCPPFQIRENFGRALAHLPGAELLYRDINEVYLLHGTGPDIVLSISTYGINERFTTVALFGKGSYFAEDSGKNDQYVRGDSTLGAYPELHRRLFPIGGDYSFPEYPYKGYYLVLCRIVLGYAVRVKCSNAQRKEMVNIDNEAGPIFATADQRELAPIPGIDNPPIFYHSLVAERGAAILRFREMVQFHSARIYPEYLICYTRK
eukprot:GEMP01005661.1.p1 GENE.GEMP01005661.1~~GEMP01005661.1.p1  ORF type:complete len:1017 (+),score=181.47 GEMP01005661.1:177-3227(+)